MFDITDINIHIASFLPREDVVSFLKSSRELRNDLHNIPFKSFTFSENAGMNEIKAMMSHLDVIESLQIIRCNFVEHLLLPMKMLKELTLIYCNNIDYTELFERFKGIKHIATDGALITNIKLTR